MVMFSNSLRRAISRSHPHGLISSCKFDSPGEIVPRVTWQNCLAHCLLPMGVDLPETTSKREGPLVRQFSVFLANKVGAMLDIVKLLNANHTHVVALSVSESTDSAIARIVVSDPERVEELFRQNDIAFGVCEVVVVE